MGLPIFGPHASPANDATIARDADRLGFQLWDLNVVAMPIDDQLAAMEALAPSLHR